MRRSRGKRRRQEPRHCSLATTSPATTAAPVHARVAHGRAVAVSGARACGRRKLGVPRGIRSFGRGHGRRRIDRDVVGPWGLVWAGAGMV